MTTGPDWRLSRFDTVASTSDICIARAEAGEPSGFAVLARSQTKARGSRGRGWSEASGTLALSVLLRPADDRQTPAIWPFLAAIAFHDALCTTPTHSEAIRLKWPNDIMLGQRKLGGILVERGVLPGAGWLVIGFGANLDAAPDLDGREAACLAELGEPAPRADDIADRLLAALSLRIGEAQASGFAHIRHAWLARAHPTGTMLAVSTPDGQTTGSFSSIAEDGTLLLAVAGEIRRISTGEVLSLQEG